MTKKDYVRLATVLRNHQPIESSSEVGRAMTIQWESDVVGIANALQADNPRLDFELFSQVTGAAELSAPNWIAGGLRNGNE